MNQGLDDYVSKPVKSTDLFNVIRKWLGEDAGIKQQEAMQESKPEDQLDVHVLNQLKELGGPDFAGQLYTDFETEAGELLTDAKKEVDAKHYKEILSTLHQIKGTASTLGLNPMAQTAKQLEHDIKTGELETVPAGFEKLLQQYRQFTQTYKHFITLN